MKTLTHIAEFIGAQFAGPLLILIMTLPFVILGGIFYISLAFLPPGIVGLIAGILVSALVYKMIQD